LLEADMRIAIQAVISDIEGQDTRTEDIGVLEYDAESAPASGLELFIGETHQLLRQLQTVVLREQVARFLERTSRCRQCGFRLGVKDTKTIVYRTVYGKAHLDSPRLYSACGRCGTHVTPARSFSPLADALPERTHPQWLWLQSRYAAVMSYRRAQTFLRDAFPAGRSLPVSSMKVNVLHTGQRLEAEVQLAARTFIRRPRKSRRPEIEQQPAQGPQIELDVDAGYIRALPEKEDVPCALNTCAPQCRDCGLNQDTDS
jgi:predicted Zn-ribbon and HTH transcriptional regulator